jgi:hypothetical protein
MIDARSHASAKPIDYDTYEGHLYCIGANFN